MECFSWRWNPAVKNSGVIDSQTGQFCPIPDDRGFISEGSARDFTNSCGPHFKLMSLFRAQRELCKEVHDVKAFANPPDGKANRRFLIGATRRRGVVGANVSHSERVTDEIKSRCVISAERDLEPSSRPCPAIRVAMLGCHTRQDERAFSVGEAGQPVAKRGVYGIEHT
jgi:hypothetical protein